MKKTVLVLFALLLTVSIAWAHEKVKLTGYVVDVLCAKGIDKNKPEAAMKAAAGHTKECGLMDDCVKSGYGVMSDGQWYPFDAKGNELAKAIIEKTTKKDNIKVTVEGLKHEGTVMVQSITEVE